MTHNNTNTQLNFYKYTEMANRFERLMAEETKFQKDLGLATLKEWCQTGEKAEVLTKWTKQNGQPKPSAIPLSILHFNIRSFYSNQHDLVQTDDHLFE
jgi:hypothetical protein